MRRWLESLLLEVWYGPQGGWLSWCLRPLGRLTGWYLRWRPALVPQHLPVPLVVVGNLTVGGTGKTPLTRALAVILRQQGWHPGIISRGYGASVSVPQRVMPADDPAVVGDEPLLLAHDGMPVWVGRDRVAAGAFLLAAHPEVDVLLCDDGLQHRRLAPTLALMVVDGQRGWGNGRLLPAGPLREPVARVREMDEVVINRGFSTVAPMVPPGIERHSVMTLEALAWVSLDDESRRLALRAFAGRSCVALAGIGHPQRFFEQLNVWDIVAECLTFPDHHRYGPGDLPELRGRPLLMTEKDAIKWRRLSPIGGWYLQITAHLEQGLVDRMLSRLATKDIDG